MGGDWTKSGKKRVEKSGIEEGEVFKPEVKRKSRSNSVRPQRTGRREKKNGRSEGLKE